MSKTLDFLSMPDVSEITETIFVNDRLGEFVIKPMTIQQHKEYQNRCKSKIGKGGMDFDSAKFNTLVMIGQTISPDLSNADMLSKLKCSTPTDLINMKFLPGEVAEIADKICSLSGFDTEIKEKIEEAKN